MREDPLSPSPGGGGGGLPLGNFSPGVGKISAILCAGGPDEPQHWWRGQAAWKIFSPGVGKISAIL